VLHADSVNPGSDGKLMVSLTSLRRHGIGDGFIQIRSSRPVLMNPLAISARIH
jgi:hypothetical protein